jgi:hypothetical protein
MAKQARDNDETQKRRQRSTAGSHLVLAKSFYKKESQRKTEKTKLPPALFLLLRFLFYLQFASFPIAWL